MNRTGWLGFLIAVSAASAFLIFKDQLPATAMLRFVAASAAVAVALVALFWFVDPPHLGADLDVEVAYRMTQGASLGDSVEGLSGIQDTRSVVWPSYVAAFRSNPAFGDGLGTGWGTPGVQEPHNLGLQLLGETGIVGLLAFVGLAFVVGRYGAGTIGAVALTVVAASTFTQTVLFEPTLWFAGALYLGRVGAEGVDSRETPETTMQW